MALITWSDELSVKIKEIDNQHKKLIDLINSLNDAMKVGKGKEVMDKILKELTSYTVTHFSNEEKYFDKYGYPDTKAHKETHTAFVNKMTEFKDKFEQGKLSLSIEVMNFLSDWLKKHIMGTDQKYSSFFNGKGLN
ncbi:MAG: bacteriohemerythrin [Candidatus Auribacterota bacterium]